MNPVITQLKGAVAQLFEQLENCLAALSDAEYSTKSRLLFGATIGQHVRHIIELFAELEKGYAAGIVDYEKRQRDHAIETNKNLAVLMLTTILQQLEKPAKSLLLHASYKKNGDQPIEMPTNYYRELAYNLEHTVHHMALIRVGIAELSQVPVDSNFGIASATIKYRQSCAQ